jgi:sRNA-binding regulator protein Hfq
MSISFFTNTLNSFFEVTLFQTSARLKTSLREVFQMGSGKKKESLVVKPSIGSTTVISTTKQQLPKGQEKPEANQGQIAVPVGDKEIKGASVKVGEKVDAGSFIRGNNPPLKLSDYTGKDRQRYWEWVRFKTPIKIKLLNGEIFEGYLKWYDQFAVKLVAATDEIVIPKHSVLCIFDGPRPKREAVVKDT